MSVRLKLSVLITILFLTTIINAFFTFQLERYGDDKLKWVDHTNEVLMVKGKLLSAIKDAETGQRGYLLADNPSYLEPYYAGVYEANSNFYKLKELTIDNAEQQERLELIETIMELKFDELAETIAFVQGNEKDKALEIVLQDKGKKYMDDIKNQFILFANVELILLEKRKGDFRENRVQITTLIIVGLLFFIGLAIMTVMFLQKSLFLPLRLLLASIEKVESGNKIEISDVIENNEMGRLISTFFIMSDKVYQRAQTLAYKANHDELTGLKNRATIFEEIKNSINGLQQLGGKIAILFLDLNLFKKINDTLGHDVGDLILKETATRLNHSVRSSDTVFRMGGDEFLVIVRNIKDISYVHTAVTNILKEFEEPAMIQGQLMNISISIGVAISPDDTSNNNEIVKFSDIAMYEAKRDKDVNYKIFDKSMLERARNS